MTKQEITEIAKEGSRKELKDYIRTTLWKATKLLEGGTYEKFINFEENFKEASCLMEDVWMVWEELRNIK